MRRALTIFLLVALPTVTRGANKDIERLQVQVAALQSQITDLLRTTEDTLREVRRLNEVMADQNASLKKGAADRGLQEENLQSTLKELNDRVAELSDRLSALNTPTGVASPTPSGLPPSSAPAAAAAPPGPELFQQAYSDYARGNFDLAIQEFEEYLRNYPQTAFSDNAQYWIGEAYYGKQQYREAIAAWETLFQNYPASDKLPDAHFKKGMALERLSAHTRALAEYRYVMDHYPNSEAGRKAREKLNP